MSHPYWPLFDLEVRTPRLTLRCIDDELSVQLASLASKGVHDPASTPFSIPWTDLEPPELERGVLRFHWRTRAETTATNWRIPFATIVDGVVVGSTDLAAADFPRLRSFETGSWLGQEYQRRGIGKEIGVAGRRLRRPRRGRGDDGRMGGQRGLARRDQGARLPIPGCRRSLRRDEPDELHGYRMSRGHFDTIRRDDIEITGIEPVRELLGLA